MGKNNNKEPIASLRGKALESARYEIKTLKKGIDEREQRIHQLENALARKEADDQQALLHQQINNLCAELDKYKLISKSVKR